MKKGSWGLGEGLVLIIFRVINNSGYAYLLTVTRSTIFSTHRHMRHIEKVRNVSLLGHIDLSSVQNYPVLCFLM